MLDSRAIQRQFAERRDRMLARAAAYPILLIGAGILVFSAWDHWLDPVHAGSALRYRLATVALLLPLYLLLRQRLVHGRWARCLHCAVFLVGMLGSTLAVLQLNGGLLWGLAGILMFPLALGFYPLSVSWYLGSALLGLLTVVAIALAHAQPAAQLINLLAMYAISSWIGVTAIQVLKRQQFKLFVLEHKHAEEARTDALTGLINRRSLEEAGRRLCLAAQRNRRPTALLLFDIDHFKHVNDEFGHDVGDEALVLVAQALGRTLRSLDYVGRWGGEEFVALLPDTNSAQAAFAADRCLEAVRAIRFAPRGQRVVLHVSIGIAQWQSGETLDGWMKRADLALYAAKSGGRNRAVIDAGQG